MFNKKLKLLSLVLLFLFIIYPPVHTEESSVSDLPKPYPKLDFSEDVAYKVIRVIDGDTIELEYGPKKKDGFRFLGVNTPESTTRKQPYGKEASAFVKNLLGDESVYLRFDGDTPTRGNYKRILVDIYRAPDGLSVNFELVRQGYARVMTKYSAPHKGLLLHYAYKARQAKRGLWGLEHYLPKDYTVDPKWEDITVYVSQTGSKYHTDACKLRDEEWVKVTLAEADFDYKPCSVCDPLE